MLQPTLALFAFNRPDLLTRVCEAIRVQTVAPPRIVAFLDGPRHNNDIPAIDSCRNLLCSLPHLELIERPRNVGCARNLILGLHTASQVESFVVLEDDTLPASNWYATMCGLLQAYQNNPIVLTVGGYPSIHRTALPTYADVIFIPRFSCWGWGSWGDKWKPVDIELTTGIREWRPEHLLDVSIGNMICDALQGTLWDAFVAGAMLHRGGLQAVTRYYLINNIGAGQHLNVTQLAFMQDQNMMQDRMPQSYPPAVHDEATREAVADYVRAMS